MIQQTINIAGIMEDSIVDGPGPAHSYFCAGLPAPVRGLPQPGKLGVRHGHGYDSAGPVLACEEKSAGARRHLFRRRAVQPGGAFTELAKLLKANGYEVASYTGYTFEELLENGTPAQKQLLAALDILVDGEFVLAQRNLDLRFRGSENQRILDVPQSLAQGRAVWCTAARWVGERQS